MISLRVSLMAQESSSTDERSEGEMESTEESKASQRAIMRAIGHHLLGLLQG